jgi:hypothetical protein
MLAANNTQFLAQCVHRIPTVNFADRETGRIYLRFESGRLAWTDPQMLGRALEDEETSAGILAIAPEATSSSCGTGSIQVLQPSQFHTLGQWGGGASPVA